MTDSGLTQLKTLIRDVPDFPKPGIVFKDITPLLSDPEGLSTAISLMQERISGLEVDLVAGPEARGFLFGAPLAARMKRGFIPLRKKGKLPYKTVEERYALEYGEDVIQMHADAVKPGQRVLLVDDLLATGGTIAACRRLIESAGGIVVGQVFLIELTFLNGREVAGSDAPVIALIEV